MAVYDDDDTDELLDSETPGEDRFYAIRKRFREAESLVSEQYAACIEDFKFAMVPGNQWDANLTQLRNGRPCYEINVLRPNIKQVINDNRKNTPTIKVRPVENGDTDTAELRQGIIRNIESMSEADTSYDYGALWSITSGFGCWRVVVKYAGDDTFDQDIFVDRMDNPFSVYWGPSFKPTREDARYMFVLDDMERSEFKDKYPNAECKDFSGGLPAGLAYEGWYSRDKVRVAEYWCKHRRKKTIYKLSDGRVVDAKRMVNGEEMGFDLIKDVAANPPIDPATGQPKWQPITIVDTREVEYDKITVEILSGDETLEGPTEWAGDHFNVIPCWGDYFTVEGKNYFYGMTRMARDPQSILNFSQSNLVESIASQPKSPYLVTDKMIEGHEDDWQNMAVNNPPALRYTPDPAAPNAMPSRLPPPVLANGWFDLSRINSDNIKDVTGVHNASLGKQSNETSGRAIMARQQEGDVATFDYQDNIARAIAYTGKVINNLMSKVLTAEREMRVLGEGDTEKYVTVNKAVQVPDDSPQGFHWERENDLTEGKYDVIVTVGPSFTTQRMETLAAMTDLAQIPGPMGMLFSYGILKYMDTPGISEFADTARKMLIAQGVPLPPEEGEEPTPPPQPPPPNPKDVAQAENYAADAQKKGAETQGIELDNMEKEMRLAAQQALMAMPPPVAPMGPMDQFPGPMDFPGAPDFNPNQLQ